MLDLLEESDQEQDGLVKLGPWASRIHDPFVLSPPQFEAYPTPDDVREASERSLRMADTLLEYLSEILPAELKLEIPLPARFWEVFLALYLTSVTGIVEDIRTRCQRLSDRSLVYGAPGNGTAAPPQTLKDYLRECLSRTALRIHVMDACVRGCLPISREWPVLYKEEPLAEDMERSWRRLPARLVFATARIVAKVLSGRRGTGEIWWSDNQAAWVDLLRLGRIGFTPFKLSPRYCRIPYIQPNRALRDRLFRKLPAPYSTVLALTFPAQALEGLEQILQAGRGIVNNLPGKAKRIYSTSCWDTQEPIRAAVGLLAAEGAKIVSIQHGGGYGIYDVAPWSRTEYKRSDVFLSWGWTDTSQCFSANPRIVPLPSLYLSRLAGGRAVRRTKWQVLLLVFSESLYPKWLYSPIFPDQAHDYFGRQKTLLDGFRAIRSVAVKLYPYEFGWRQNECLARRYPEFAMLRHGSFVQWARCSRLCVVDYNSTGFLELLAMGRPFLATWNRRWFHGTELFERHLDTLREAGIFYESPEELVKAVSDIEPQTESWWAEPFRRKAVAAIAERYALTSKDPLPQWQRFMSTDSSRTELNQ